MGRHTDPTSDTMYCYGANSQSQNQSTLKTENTFNATAPAPTNSANMMCATKVDSEPPQARNAALIAKRAHCIPLQWCHRDHNLRDRDFTKNLETWKSRPRLETWKLVHFAEIKKKCPDHFLVEFFLHFCNFVDMFCFFLPPNTTNKDRRIIEMLLCRFFATFKDSRPVAFETETERRRETFQIETRKNAFRPARSNPTALLVTDFWLAEPKIMSLS